MMDVIDIVMGAGLKRSFKKVDHGVIALNGKKRGGASVGNRKPRTR
jgi:hypothetical protein